MNEYQLSFQAVGLEHREMVHTWLKLPHVAEWFYGQGLKNTHIRLDAFLQGSSISAYWLVYDHTTPIAFFITSYISKLDHTLYQWLAEKKEAITLDMLIGNTDYLGKGLSTLLIEKFLLAKFPEVAAVLIDPEIKNARAIHVYKKIGFKILGEYIPSHNPRPHYMMRLNMKQLINAKCKKNPT